jgi:hypothetical protein
LHILRSAGFGRFLAAFACDGDIHDALNDFDADAVERLGCYRRVI